ncbi:MAG: helicase-related protein [Candidatus Hodarchaeales archaeon]
MLLRRLKRRLAEGGRIKPFICVATSATLAEGEGAKSAISSFATDLFGEQFESKNIILGEPEDRIWDLAEKTLPPTSYTSILEILLDDSEERQIKLIKAAQKLNISLPDNAELPLICGAILLKDKRCSKFFQLVMQRPYLLNEIADFTFYDIVNKKERLRNIINLVRLLSYAKNPESGTPLLLPRYHVFLRSLEGAFLSYLPEKKVFLDRRTTTHDGAAFELALCRECGQHYLVGRIEENKMVEAVRDPSHPNFGATFFLPIKDSHPKENDNHGAGRKFQLCARCGAISPNDKKTQCFKCSNLNLIIVERQEEAQEREDQIPRCISCGYKAPDPVREIVHGSDGPHAVISTTLYKTLPEKRKKLLAFADGRQEAAFFAWYLEDSYRDILSRGLLLRAALRIAPYTSEGLSLQELSSEMHRLFKENRMLPPSLGELEIRKKAWLAVYKEYLTEEQRISLEGVGLLRWSLKLPEWFEIPEVLLEKPWNLSQEEVKELTIVLLDYMRNDKAVEIHTERGVSLNWNDFGLQSSQTRVCIGMPKGAKGVRSWDGKRGKRARFLTKVILKEDGFSEGKATEIAVQALRIIWDKIRECDEKAPSIEHRLFLPVRDAKRLNPDWWRLYVTSESDRIFRCDTCARLQPYSVRGICARPNCLGILTGYHLKDLEANHYRRLYEEDLPPELRVEEHTAQLAKEKARQFQREFREGKIHVLSCSTTFELGVDLGDLDNIFLRNVPPETFNYIQRVGRAGRRGRPGFAITYCKRGPHDLYHFSNPELMLSGKTRAPTLALQNEKIILRHMTAAVLSEYFRIKSSRFEKVENLLSDMTNPSGVSDFKSFLYKNMQTLEQILLSIVPENMIGKIGLADSNWIEYIAGDNSRFYLAELEVSSDFNAAGDLEKRSAAEGAYDVAKWAHLRAKTIAEEDVLSFLSRKVVIPKYGFPVDVVELDIHRTKQNYESYAVALDRDLAIAIAEFAPTSKVIANKKIWSSYGIKRVAGKELRKCSYNRCIRHNFFVRWEEGQQPNADNCCEKVIQGKYIVPIFGFVSDLDKPKNPTSRPARVFATRPYFAGLSVPNPGSISIPSKDKPMIVITPACPGEMVVLCEGKRGRGFYVCVNCGAGFRNIKLPHKNPFGTNCTGQLELVSL